MAAASAPYGLRPVNRLDGSPYAGPSRQYRIANAYNTSIFYGDAVTLVTAGVVQKDTGTDAMTPIGIFMGCSYTDPNTGQKLFKQHYPASTAAADIRAYVVDDPDVVMKAVVCSSGTTVGTVAVTEIGANMAVIQTAGSTVTGNSYVAVNSGSNATTNTLPLRIIDVVAESDSTATTFTEVLVKWNVGHQFRNTQGLA